MSEGGSEKASRLAAQVEQIVLKKINEDKLAVPAMPAAATKALSLLRTPDYTTKQVVTVLEQDPALSARILRLASSAAHNPAGAQMTLSTAVVRLGNQRTKSVLIQSAAQQLYESKDRRIATAARGIFEHSLAVALLSRDLAAIAGQGAAADTAYLCGLLHDVGKVVVAGILLEAEKVISFSRPGQSWVGSEDWLEAVSRCHRSVGLALCSKWALPEEVTSAIQNLGDYDNTNRTTPGNYVRFANAVAKKEGLYSGIVNEEEVESLLMIGRSLLGIDEDVMAKAVEPLRERVRAQLG